jgi:uncharacterized protein (TIGR03435 family)
MGVRFLGRSCAAGLIGLASMMSSLATGQAVNAERKGPEFEVASIKPSHTQGNGYDFDIEANRFTTTGTVQRLACFAYNIKPMYCSGGPGWVGSDRFDINAEMDDGVMDAMKKMSSKEQEAAYQSMMQALLRDRFKLQVKVETKELPIYALVVAKGGPKLTPAVVHPGEGSSSHGSSEGTMTKRTAKNETMEFLADSLTEERGVEKTVADETGLNGSYDFELKWQKESAASDATGPSIFTALQEQLGLRLEAKKGPVKTLVVEHVERPSEN